MATDSPSRASAASRADVLAALRQSLDGAAQAPGTVRYTGSLRLADTDDELADCIHQRDAMRSDSRYAPSTKNANYLFLLSYLYDGCKGLE